MLEKWKETAKFLASFCKHTPDYAIVLGTGLGDLADEIKVEHRVAYTEIPNFPVSTVQGHSGELIFGELGGKFVVAMKGRFHYYEGYEMAKVIFPMRVFGQMGIKNIIVSNAAGGVNEAHKIGDIMLIDDHINMIPEHPLRGKNCDEVGPRFVDMKNCYDLEMLAHMHLAAKRLQVDVCQGCYLALQGPTFETQKEYSMVHILGGDAVGMSTVPEVIIARHQGQRVLGLSIITDLGLPGKMKNVSHEEVQQIGREVTPKVISLVKEFVKTFKL